MKTVQSDIMICDKGCKVQCQINRLLSMYLTSSDHIPPYGIYSLPLSTLQNPTNVEIASDISVNKKFNTTVHFH